MPEKDEKQQQINFSLDANKTPVLYADGYLIGSNQHVVTLNFAQAMPEPSQQNIVTRVALTKEQAKEFLNNLKDHIEKFEV
ncbi:DUF3467 domain-containing protein [Candidatus Parcubacteria bacterium]|nr:DUF3467 domain-containing protein [Candidatus Parcubacteria bacterium]